MPEMRVIARMARRVRFILLCALLAGTIAFTAWFAERQSASISGTARIVDGDSLYVDGTEIRLFGIDAPELHQTCQRGGRLWNCGADAAAALRAASAGKDIVCKPRERDRYGRTVAVCQAGGLDLGAAMIKGGYAVSYGGYEADEREARDARRGIWSSSFDNPAAWRARHPRPPRS
ncbi:MAG TPA: thermonuclease family protein [Xanthobacteraceae bacterium]|jgi:endonuclease YncB( thermonuclease family)